MNSRFPLRHALARLLWLGVGFAGGLMVAGRYSFTSPLGDTTGVYVIDQLTGRMWVVAHGAWRPMEEMAGSAGQQQKP